MDAKLIGQNISDLRKKNGITQTQLATKLNVSNKTVSKWENGQGFPDITQFPNIAKIFGVTVDYLMSGERKGITIAGNILVDLVMNIDCFPEVGMLSNITSISKAVGGIVPNTAINLAKIDRSLPLSAIGKVGDDENGRYVTSQLQKYGIDTSQISVSSNADASGTSFSNVYTLPTGERTFFHARGENRKFSPEDINIQNLTGSMLHGGSGLSDDDFRNAIRHGIAKVNIFTDLCIAGEKAMAQGVEKGLSYLDMRNLKVSFIKEEAKKKMLLFGSDGKC